MADRELEQALDELYNADPSEFVALRKALAQDLRDAGDRAAAALLRAARRPSTSAWALNQIARRRPELIEQLLERSRVLVDAQTRAIAGERESMRDATVAHRASLDEATQAALGILGPRAHDSFRSEIVATLRAASTDESVGRMLQLGRLVREASSSGGFPDAAGLTVTAIPRSTDGPRRNAKRPPTPAGDSTESEEIRTAEREQERRAEAARAEAQRRAAAAEADAVRAQERVKQLERDLVEARQDLQEARVRSKQAQAEARRAPSPG
jgi:hypothetical protein